MNLLKDISKSLNFQDRYSEMEGAQTGTANEGYDREEYKSLTMAQKGGATLSPAEKERLKYLKTVRDERTRAATTLGAAAAGTIVGAYTGNPAMVKSSLAMGAGYVMEEAGEVDGPNDGTGQQLGFEDFTRAAAPMMTTIGQGDAAGMAEQRQGNREGRQEARGIRQDDRAHNKAMRRAERDTRRENRARESGEYDQIPGEDYSYYGTYRSGGKLNYASGGKMNLRNRYNPRKHDYIKGNTFGLK